MKDGVGAEFGSPKELLGIEDGVFKGMVAQSGEKQEGIGKDGRKGMICSRCTRQRRRIFREAQNGKLSRTRILAKAADDSYTVSYWRCNNIRLCYDLDCGNA
jgi:hypothetical protein